MRRCVSEMSSIVRSLFFFFPFFSKYVCLVVAGVILNIK